MVKEVHKKLFSTTQFEVKCNKLHLTLKVKNSKYLFFYRNYDN